jgi:hypothetical protein
MATFSVHGRRAQIECTAWHVLDDAGRRGETPRSQDVAVSSNGVDLVWSPRPEALQDMGNIAPHGLSVACELRAPSTGERPVEVVYYMTGVTWAATYSVLLRGDLASDHERVAVEFDAVVSISNGTQRTFHDATLKLVGVDAPPSARPTDEPGFLMLDDESPLSDLWRESDSDDRDVYAYDVRGAATITARGETVVALATAARQPADRLYRLEAADLPVEGRQPARPLRKCLVLRNVEGTGLGFSLPAGAARIYVGSARSTQLQAAWFAHTPASGEMLIDLGESENVLVSRRYTGRKREAEGLYLESYELIVENRLAEVAPIEIAETPPTGLTWDLASSRIDCVQRGRRLIFSTQVEGRTTQNIDYSIRVHEPAL